MLKIAIYVTENWIHSKKLIRNTTKTQLSTWSDRSRQLLSYLADHAFILLAFKKNNKTRILAVTAALDYLLLTSLKTSCQTGGCRTGRKTNVHRMCQCCCAQKTVLILLICGKFLQNLQKHFTSRPFAFRVRVRACALYSLYSINPKLKHNHSSSPIYSII